MIVCFKKLNLIKLNNLFIKMDNVYLCLGDRSGYQCKAFSNYLEADRYHSELCKMDPNVLGNKKSTMIPIAKFAPDWYKKFYLQRELAKIFGNVELVPQLGLFDGQTESIDLNKV
jgi:hypothetical protein